MPSFWQYWNKEIFRSILSVGSEKKLVLTDKRLASKHLIYSKFRPPTMYMVVDWSTVDTIDIPGYESVYMLFNQQRVNRWGYHAPAFALAPDSSWYPVYAKAGVVFYESLR